MTKTEISHLFGRNKSADRIARALTLLLHAGRVRRKAQKTEGRQAERWFAARNLTKYTKYTKKATAFRTLFRFFRLFRTACP
jgi:hypothetical protein